MDTNKILIMWKENDNTNVLSNIMEQSLTWEANSHSATQEIPRSLPW
jgi:hypothetical protein